MWNVEIQDSTFNIPNSAFHIPLSGARRMRARQTGFTLIELILVMLIACVVMAITAPSLRNFLYGRKTANAVSQIVSLASEARSKAIMDGRTYRLNVDTTAGTFWLDAQNGGDFK